MAVEPAGTLPLRGEADIVASRQMVRTLAQHLKWSLVEQTKMITAASELSRNTVVHGGGGQMRWEILKQGLRVGLRLHFEDTGPGIPDVAAAMSDGWTSGRGMGLGLPGSKRLVSDFELTTQVGVGTQVRIAKWK